MVSKGKRNPMQRRKPISRSLRSGLFFPVGRIATMLRKGLYAERISEGAAIALASILEYMIFEIIEQSMMFLKEDKKARLVPKYIRSSIENDEEFAEIFGKESIIALEHKKKRRRRVDENEEDNGKTQKMK